MAITMSLYQVNDDSKVMGKTIPTATSTHTILLKEGCSIDEPVVTFSAQASAIAPLNYAYIDTFGRYYYIRERKSLVNGIVELTLESDAIESFKDYIKEVNATISRYEKAANAYLLDNAYQMLAYDKIVAKEFPQGLTDESIVLLTVG